MFKSQARGPSFSVGLNVSTPNKLKLKISFTRNSEPYELEIKVCELEIRVCKLGIKQDQRSTAPT